MTEENQDFDSAVNTDDENVEEIEEVEVVVDEEEEDGERVVGVSLSESMVAQSMIDPDMPSPHGSIVEGANGGEGTTVRAAYLGKEMQT